MAVLPVDELYEKYIKHLPSSERQRLVEITTHDLAIDETSVLLGNQDRRRSLLELEGLGAEIWEGIDAQDYVNELRAEWDHRP